MPIGPWEIAILLLILAIIFGAGRLYQLGRSVRNFRTASRGPTRQAAVTSVTVTAPPVTCATCQTVNPSTNRFCSSCGADLTKPVEAVAETATEEAPAPAGETVCPSCATVNPSTQAFCGQ